jgi:hypothetical protein
MSITLKGLEVVNIANMPKSNILLTEKYSAKTTYDILKTLKLIKKEAINIDEARIEIANQLGRLNEETNQYEFEDGGLQFSKEYSELLESDITIEGIQKFNPMILKDISVSEYELIQPLFNDYEICEVMELVDDRIKLKPNVVE